MNRSIVVLARALRDAPVTVTGGDRLDHGRVTVLVEGPSVRLMLKALWAGEGWPKDVEAAVVGVPDPWPHELVVTAREFSPGALRLLEERDANWADETGEARIVGPRGLLVIRRHGSASTALGLQKDDGREAASGPGPFRWSRSGVGIAEALLARRPDAITTTDLAETIGWSAAQASRVLARFDEQGWTKKIGAVRGPRARREFVDPDGLLRRWAEFVAKTPRRSVQAHALVREPLAFLGRLAPVLTETVAWAATTWAGLELLAPFASAVPVVHLYVEEESFDDGTLPRLMQRTKLREVEEGGRVVFWAGDQSVFRLAQEVPAPERLPVVSAPRLYADLRSLGGRGTDAAEHVREALLGS